jgi:hypothetical protein
MEQTNQINPLVSAVVSAFDAYILALVDKRVAEILQTQASLHVINEEMTKKIEEIVNNEIEEHEARHDHLSQDSITQDIDQALSEFDIDDKVRDAVRNLSFSVEVD